MATQFGFAPWETARMTWAQIELICDEHGGAREITVNDMRQLKILRGMQ